MRSFSGCWTCRVRRKKCDENHPVCDACAALHIACYYDQDKPEWMDGGVRQEEMAQRLKRQVREQRHRRRGDHTIQPSGDCVSEFEALSDRPIPPEPSEHAATPVSDLPPATEDSSYTGYNDTFEQSTDASSLCPRRKGDGTLDGRTARESETSRWPDSCLSMFYLENLLPFLFPFYRPSLADGGRSWILDIMMTSHVVRQTALCQSSYFFPLALGIGNCYVTWNRVLRQTRDAFGTLRQSLLALDGQQGIADHLCEAVRILAGVIQLLRFDIAVSSFENCQAHLNASVALFKQILDSRGTVNAAGLRSSLDAVMTGLGTPSWTLPSECIQLPSAEQAAFRFSAALVILDDIIASTALQQKPILYKYHHLLKSTNEAEPSINIEAVAGCQNWVLVQIGEIATLDAWKQQCKKAGNLDIMELVYRAAAIKDTLVAQLARLEADSAMVSKRASSVLDSIFTPYYNGQPSESFIGQRSLVTRVWAHAAFLYLFVVVSGWQPASVDVRYHVSRIIELLKHQMSPPALLRTMVWPFCVAGCLAEPALEGCLREMVEVLQPPSIFGTVRKALEIMENVWSSPESGDLATRDLATCLRSQGHLVLLV